jgi:hypothetical protein
MAFSMRKTLPTIVLCVAMIFVSSCASLQRSWDQGAVRQTADLINAGDAQKLASVSASPFILDGEVVVLPADVAGFWTGILKAGFRVEAASLDTGTAVGADSYRQFADTMEVRSFFARYVKDGARILDLSTAAGTHIRLLVRSDWFSWKILGWKGPF